MASAKRKAARAELNKSATSTSTSNSATNGTSTAAPVVHVVSDESADDNASQASADSDVIFESRTFPPGHESNTSNAKSTSSSSTTKNERTDEMQVDEPPPPVPGPTAAELKELGNALFSTGKYSAAIEKYSAAISQDPKNPAYYSNRAAAQMGLKKFELALQDCQSSIALDPAPKTVIRAARCHLKLGDAASAIRLLAGLPLPDVQLKQKSEKVENIMNRVEKEFESKQYRMVQVGIRNAEAEIGAESTFESPLKWRLIKIKCDICMGNLDTALSELSNLLIRYNNAPDLIYQKARVHFLKSEFNHAVSHLQRVMQLDPDFVMARTLLKKVRAIERAKEAGNTAFKQKNYSEAVEKYTEALDTLQAQSSDSAEQEVGEGKVKAVLLGNRGNAYTKMLDYTAALEDVNNSLQLDPTYMKAMRTRARIYLAQEKYEDAIAEFKAAIEEASGDDDVRGLQSEVQNAEFELKKSKRVNHYKVMGLEKDASSAEIKKAYRTMSLLHHPDKGGSEEQFKLISTSYSILSDPQKKHQYDTGADIEDDHHGFGGGGGFPGGVDISQLFNMGGASFPQGAYSGGHSHSHFGF